MRLRRKTAPAPTSATAAVTRQSEPVLEQLLAVSARLEDLASGIGDTAARVRQMAEWVAGQAAPVRRDDPKGTP